MTSSFDATFNGLPQITRLTQGLVFRRDVWHRMFIAREPAPSRAARLHSLFRGTSSEAKHTLRRVRSALWGTSDILQDFRRRPNTEKPPASGEVFNVLSMSSQ